MQVGVGGWNSDFSKKVKKRKQELDIFLEAQIGLPKTDEDVARFEREVQIAQETGIDIFRAICLSGRRYETFDSIAIRVPYFSIEVRYRFPGISLTGHIR